MDDKSLQHEILITFDAVKKTLKTLCFHVQADLIYLPAWIDRDGKLIYGDNVSSKKVVREQAIDAFLRLIYESNLTAQETFARPGALAANHDTLLLVDDVNKAKDDFYSIVQNVRKIKKQDASQFIQDTMAKTGGKVVKLRQVFRHIHYVNYHPYRIAWSQGAGARIKKLSHQEAAKKLRALGDNDVIDAQLNKLNMLQPNDELRIRQSIEAHWLVNVACKKEGSRAVTQKITTSLPIFYVHDVTQPLPDVEYAVKRPRHITRADKIADTLYLSSIKAYCPG